MPGARNGRSGRSVVRRLTCYQIHETAPRLVPGRSDRGWMDATDKRYAYRCLPLSITNSMGWEILTPARLVAEWNGRAGLSDISITIDDPNWTAERLASSHFGHGILTFQTGYLFRTDPGIAIWARGAPNWVKDGIAPLDGVIETDWLPFTFTMNWRFTRPGCVTFEKDEPLGFITPIEYRALETIEPEIVSIMQEPALHESYRTWSEARQDLNKRLSANEPEAVKQGWQKWYPRGETPDNAPVSALHVSKLKLAEPRIKPQKTTLIDRPEEL